MTAFETAQTKTSDSQLLKSSRPAKKSRSGTDRRERKNVIHVRLSDHEINRLKRLGMTFNSPGETIRSLINERTRNSADASGLEIELSRLRIIVGTFETIIKMNNEWLAADVRAEAFACLADIRSLGNEVGRILKDIHA